MSVLELYLLNLLFTFRELLFSGVLIAMAACIVLRTFIPTKEAAVWIAEGYIATNIEGIEDMPANAVKGINSFLESVSEEEK